MAVAKRILGAKNVPYFVSAPLLIQDIASWTRQGVGGLQSVVLYALPELDGAIDPVPLGGLVGDKIYLVPERMQRLTERVKAWVNLRRKPPERTQGCRHSLWLPPRLWSRRHGGVAECASIPAATAGGNEASRI